MGTAVCAVMAAVSRSAPQGLCAGSGGSLSARNPFSSSNPCARVSDVLPRRRAAWKLRAFRLVPLPLWPRSRPWLRSSVSAPRPLRLGDRGNAEAVAGGAAGEGGEGGTTEEEEEEGKEGKRVSEGSRERQSRRGNGRPGGRGFQGARASKGEEVVFSGGSASAGLGMSARQGRRGGEEEDASFEERLTALKMSGKQRKAEKVSKLYAPIDYDNPEADTSTLGGFFSKDLGSKGAAVLSVELGDLHKADTLLDTLEKVAPSDVEVLRLHGEVQFALGNFSASTGSTRRAIQISASPPSIELLQGLTESLLAENKPQEAISELLRVRTALAPSDAQKQQVQQQQQQSEDSPVAADPVQVELLLGKAYSAWGRPGDAGAVYDRLMQSRPDDFRGYLAKGILFLSQDKEGDAQRMFLQAKFLAPDAAKALVDRFAARASPQGK